MAGPDVLTPRQPGGSKRQEFPVTRGDGVVAQEVARECPKLLTHVVQSSRAGLRRPSDVRSRRSARRRFDPHFGRASKQLNAFIGGRTPLSLAFPNRV